MGTPNVVGFDGRPVGIAKQLKKDSFLVLTTAGETKCLRTDAIFEADAHSIRLICYADAIERWLCR